MSAGPHAALWRDSPDIIASWGALASANTSEREAANHILPRPPALLCVIIDKGVSLENELNPTPALERHIDVETKPGLVFPRVKSRLAATNYLVVTRQFH